MVVDASGIACTGRTVAGVSRAVSTAAQLLDGTDRLQYQVIDDFPRFAWRGLMVDVARSFRTVDELRQVVDLCALYKLNALHLHLTDNEAWRLEIPGMPELTTPDTSSAGPGRYTVAQFAQLQDYAADRLVTIVPEIDLPGHCTALVRACPWLARLPRPEWLDERIPYTGPLDHADGATWRLSGKIVSAVAAQTRGRFVHIGADEALGASSRAFAASVRKLRAMVRESGKQPVAWQEAARAGSSKRDNLPALGQPRNDRPVGQRGRAGCPARVRPRGHDLARREGAAAPLRAIR